MINYPTVEVPRNLLTLTEVAQIFRVTRSTIDRWRSDGLLTAVKVKGAVRFRREDVERLMAPEDVA